MPIYDYECRRCGSFSALRPMAAYDEPEVCPICGAMSMRVLLTAPAIAGMAPQRRLAHATNERSAHAPRSSAGHAHGSGCGCGKPAGPAKGERKAAKAFPSARPWMIGH